MTQSPVTSIELRELVLPCIANHHGTLFAGQALQLMSKAAFMSARSFTESEVVMAGATRVSFLSPVPIGHELILRGEVISTGQTSITVAVTGTAEKPHQDQTIALIGTFVMVSVDQQGRPREHLRTAEH